MLDMMKLNLSDIQNISSRSYCNIELVEKLEKFLEYEKETRARNLCDEKALILGKIVNDFKQVMNKLLEDQKVQLDIIRTSVSTKMMNFDQITDSLILAFQINTDSSTIMAINTELLRIVSEHLCELESALTLKRKCHKILDAILLVLKDHSEWTKLAAFCSELQQSHSILTQTIKSAEGRAELLSEAYSDPLPHLKKSKELNPQILGPAVDIKKYLQTETIIKYDSVGKLKRFKLPDGGIVPRISTKFIFQNPEAAVGEMAMLGFRVLWVQQEENNRQDFAILEDNILLKRDYHAGILSPLALESFPYLLDKHASNDDGHLIVNLKGQEELKKRMFLPFHTASLHGFDIIVIDCSFGQGAPYLNHPANLGFTYLAATAFYYPNNPFSNFILAGDIHSPFCMEIFRTMSFYFKDKIWIIE